MEDRVVEDYYEATVEEEWNRLEWHKMEFATTWRAMQEFIPPGSTILDIGGGPGRYSIQLALAGHRVILFELSGANVAFARRKAEELGAPVAGFIKGNALDLGRFADASFEVVLSMGPLYHFTEEEDRRRAMEEALRVLKPGGLFFASFISRYAFIVDALKRGPASIEEFGDAQERLLSDGVNIVSEDNPGFTNAYFIHPSDIEPLMESHGLSRLRLAAVEGFIDPVEPAINSLPEKLFNRWVDLCYRLGTDPVLWGTSEHMLYVGRKG